MMLATILCKYHIAAVAVHRARANDASYAYFYCATHCRINRTRFADPCRDTVWCAAADSTVSFFSCNADTGCVNDSVRRAGPMCPGHQNFPRTLARDTSEASPCALLWCGSTACIRSEMVCHTLCICNDWQFELNSCLSFLEGTYPSGVISFAGLMFEIITEKLLTPLFVWSSCSLLCTRVFVLFALFVGSLREGVASASSSVHRSARHRLRCRRPWLSSRHRPIWSVLKWMFAILFLRDLRRFTWGSWLSTNCKK